MWEKVDSVLEDIDEIILQIEYITALDEEIFDDMKQSINKIGSKKEFLDDLQIAVSEEDYWKFMQLFYFPIELKSKIMEKNLTINEQ